MKTLHIFKTYLPDTVGGIEQVILQLCKGTQKLGVSNEVFTLSPNPEPETLDVDSIPVHRAQQNFCVASTGFSWQAFRQFQSLAARADVLHFHFPWPFMDLLQLYARPKCPSLVTYHSDIVRQKLLMLPYKPLMHHFLSSVDRITVASPNYLESSPVLQRYKAKTRVIPFGLDPQAYPTPTSERLDFWRKQFAQPFFLFVGVLRYYKGLHIALQALQTSSWPLVIVGGGPEEQNLKLLAHRLGVAHKAIFLGKLNEEDKTCLLALCQAFVFPSHLRSEAFGISLLEAAMYGKPMISCEIGTGTSFVNAHNESGLVIPPNDPQALATAMQQLQADPMQLETFGQQAQQRFRRLFTAEHMCSEMLNTYQELLHDR